MWFPVIAFVSIGFQHVVTNMFTVPAAISAGQLSWAEYLPNFVAVFLGNGVGGAVFVGLAYFLAVRQAKQSVRCNKGLPLARRARGNFIQVTFTCNDLL
nr:putative transcription regulator [Candidatus Pantoea persica]